MQIEVMGILVGVLTFSAGFLSARQHAHFDALSKDLADRSWKIRRALTEGDQLGPSDLLEDLAAVRTVKDSVAVYARAANAAILAAIVLTLLSNFVLDGDTSAGAIAMLVLLMGVGIVVFTIGEYDVLWLARQERRLLDETVLGRLSAVDQQLRSGVREGARRDVENLINDFPEWTFARELLALIDLACDDPRHDGVEMSVRARARGQHLTPLLRAERSLRDDEPVRALRESVVTGRSDGSDLERQLHDVICFAAGLHRWIWDEHRPAVPSDRPTGLDVTLGSFQELRRQQLLFHGFHCSDDVQGWLADAHGSVAALATQLALALLTDKERQAVIDEVTHSGRFAGGLTSLGIVSLCQGRSREAMQLFEAAIRARPNSSTSHWGRALACSQHGWSDAARDSLRRSASLDPRDSVVTQLSLISMDDPAAADPGGALLTNTVTDLERIQLALLGLEVQASGRPRSVRDVVVDATIAAALRTCSGLDQSRVS